MAGSELKPVLCGCGGEAFVSINGFIEYHVVCASCGLRTDWFRSKDKAITVWNRAMGATDIHVGDKERTAKVAKVDMSSEHNQVYKCMNCGQYTHPTSWSSPVNYCTNCGVKLEWNHE